MTNPDELDCSPRVRELEARVRRLTRVVAALAAGLAVAVLTGMAQDGKPREITASRLTVVDDEGRPRVVIGPDPAGVERISRGAGLVLLDVTGNERGGFSTMEDGSVVLGLDAPVGVGASMRDRIGLKVYANGAATINVINNDTGIPVRLISDPEGSGGIEFLDYDLDARKALIKRISYTGETRSEQSLDGG
jgi:hypothetical protein